MKRQIKRVVFILAFILITTCTSALAAELASAVLCVKIDPEEMNPIGISDRFPSDMLEIHSVVLVNGGKAGSEVKATWVAVDAVEEPEKTIDTAEATLSIDGLNRLHFSLVLPKGSWPPGNYRLDIREGGRLLGQAPFSFADREGSAGSPPFVSVAISEGIEKDTGAPIGISDIFASTTREIHTLVKVENGEKGQILRGTFVAVNAMEEPNTRVYTEEVDVKGDGTSGAHFGVAWTKGEWPTGRYRFDLDIDGKPLLSVPYFIIRTAGAPSAEAQQPAAAAGFNLGKVRADKKRQWTIAVYLDGDNNLEPFALKDLDEIERAMPSRGVEVLALVDRAEGFSSDQGDWKGARVYRVRPDKNEGIRSELLLDAGEINMGDPAVLQEFMSAALTTFPAKRQALILWDHGGGWASHVTDDMAPGMQGSFDKLTLPELRSAIAGALKKTGIGKLDLVGFDMCLMAQLETAYELDGLAGYMVGSEATEPGDGWPYDQVLPLFTKSKLATRDVAKGIVEAFHGYYSPRNEPITTQSAFDLAVVGDLVGSLDVFLSKLNSGLNKSWPEFTRTLFFAESYGDIGDLRRGANALVSIDLGDALKNLAAAVPGLGKSREFSDLSKNLDRFVIGYRNSPRHERSRGVALYAPFRKSMFNKKYLETRFAGRSAWLKTLNHLYDLQNKDSSKPKISNVQTVSISRNKPVSEIIQLGQDGFSFEYNGKNILWVNSLIGQKDRKSGDTYIFEKQLFIPETPEQGGGPVDIRQLLSSSSYPDGRHQFQIPYQGVRRLVSNGEKTAPVTIDATDVGDLEGKLISIPALYENPEVGKLFATIYFNIRWQGVAVTLEVPQKDGTYTYISMNPEPTDTFNILLETIEANGERAYTISETLKWKDGLTLLMDTAPPGEYQVYLALESLTGYSQMVKHSFPVMERNDDLIKGLIPADYKPDNFIGDWKAIDSDRWFQEGQKAPLGSGMKVQPHPKYKGLLQVLFYDGNGKSLFPGMDRVAVIHRGPGLPHTREFHLDAKGKPVEGMGIETVFHVFDQDSRDGRYVLLSFNMMQNLQFVFVKNSGPEPVLSMPAQQTPQQVPQQAPQSGQGQAPGGGFPPSSLGGGPLAGTWQSMDGSTVVFQGNQWAYYEFGQQMDSGIFQVEGNILQSQSANTGEIAQYQYQLMGNQLYLQTNYGEVLQYFKVR